MGLGDPQQTPIMDHFLLYIGLLNSGFLLTVSQIDGVLLSGTITCLKITCLGYALKTLQTREGGDFFLKMCDANKAVISNLGYNSLHDTFTCAIEQWHKSNKIGQKAILVILSRVSANTRRVCFYKMRTSKYWNIKEPRIHELGLWILQYVGYIKQSNHCRNSESLEYL
jgi:hypothetical protein